jgi:hypothetical protein
MLAIATSHKMRTATEAEYYKADTVEFTLLTFSYFGAKASGVPEESWFFFWKVFGSMMGLPPAQLHSSYNQAQGRMKALHAQCPTPPTADAQVLLDVFIDCYLNSDEEIRNAATEGLISKRMADYLQSKNKWPKDLLRHPLVV